jgi:branched-chain amino acid transport system ATP-binding protein
VSLDVRPGEIVLILGPNGAGKSTTLKAISGLVRAERGTIAYAGTDITALPPEAIVRHGIAHVPEGRRIFAEQSVQDNLRLGAYVRGRDRPGIAADLERMYALYPQLREKQSALGGALSGGQQQMLAIGRALMSRPRVLLLDEPSLGLAPRLVQDMFRTLQALRDEGLGILLVEQYAAALRFANRVYVLSQGQVTLEGRPEDVSPAAGLADAYLGAMPTGGVPSEESR